MTDTPTAHFLSSQDDMVMALDLASRPAQRTVRLRYTVYAAVLAVIAGLAWTAGASYGLYLTLALAFGALAGARPWLVRRHFRRITTGRADLDRPVTVRLQDAELRVEVEGVARGAQRLDTIHAVDALPDGVLVQPFPHEAFWIPARAFVDAAARAAFERTLLAGVRLPDPAL